MERAAALPVSPFGPGGHVSNHLPSSICRVAGCFVAMERARLVVGLSAGNAAHPAAARSDSVARVSPVAFRSSASVSRENESRRPGEKRMINGTARVEPLGDSPARR